VPLCSLPSFAVLQWRLHPFFYALSAAWALQALRLASSARHSHHLRSSQVFLSART